MKNILGILLIVVGIFLLIFSAMSLAVINERINSPSKTIRYSLQKVPARDYQLEIVEDSILIYDGMRWVGTIAFDSSLNEIILEDNH